MIYAEDFTKKLSFVITGVLEYKQVEKIKKVRNLFKFSPILISSWNAKNHEQRDIIENLRRIENIKVLLQDDPGPDWDNQCVNRIILSSQAAFKEVTTEFCIKTRTDIEIYGNGFIEIFLKMYQSQKQIPKYQDCRILALNLFARDPSKNGNLFHPGDNFWLGKTSDLKRFYDLPLRDLENNKTLNHNLEILMWSKVLNKVFYAQNPFHPFNNTPIDIIKSELSLIRSFHFSTEKQLCIKVPDKFYSNSRKSKDVYDPSINFYSKNSLAINFLYIFRYIRIVPLFYYHYSKIFAGEYLPSSLKLFSNKISKLRKKLMSFPNFFDSLN